MGLIKCLLMFLTLIFLSLPGVASDEPMQRTLRISAIDWCPQICPQTPSKPGYLVEMIYDIFRDSEFRLKFEFVPWSRAIYRVKIGQTDALLSPSKAEAPDLRYHLEPLSYQTHCFWKMQDSDWHFDGLGSLKTGYFVIYRDHSYSSFFTSGDVQITSDHYFELSYDERYIPRAIDFLKSKRAHAFLFTANSVIYYQQVQGKTVLAIDECIQRDELWLALSPKPSDKIDAIQAHLDQELKRYKKSLRYRNLLDDYSVILPTLFDEKSGGEVIESEQN